MTRKEVIENLKTILCGLHDEDSIEYVTFEDKEALDMAIKALEQEPCPNCIEFKRYAKQMGFEIEQEPCEDCISRQAVLEITAETGALETQARVKALPPVTPQEPKSTRKASKPIEGNNDSYNCENWIP